MPPRPLAPSAPALACALLAGGLALFAPACGGGSSRTGRSSLPPPPRFVGVLYDYADRPLEGVSLRVLGTNAQAASRIDGLAAVGGVPTGARVLRYGDSVQTPTLLLPYTQQSDSSFHPLPLYLPSLESGISATVPDGPVSGTLVLQGDALPGVSLDLTGVTVSGSGGTVRVIGVSPSRLPLPVSASVAGAAEPRAAFLVENHGIGFSPAAQLTVPLLDTTNATFDAYKVNRSTGHWELVVAGLTPAGGPVTFPVDEGTLYAVVPQATTPRVTVTGRVVSGSTPVAGYLVSCWNVSADPADPSRPARTAADGTFRIAGVPQTYGAYLVRAIPDRMGIDFAPEVVSAVSQSASLGADLQVAARRPDGIEPEVKSTAPADGATGVPPTTQVVVVFSEPIDTSHPRPFRLLGPNGAVDGALSYDNAFTARLRPHASLDPATTYNILVDRKVRDLAGNLLDPGRINFRFTTQSGSPSAPPTDTKAFSLTPLAAARGDTIEISGRNFTGGTSVRVGGSTALVTFESSDTIRAVVPDHEPAGDATVSLTAGGSAVSTLQPLVLDLRASATTIYADAALTTPLDALDRNAPPATVVVAGFNVGGASVTIDGVPFAASDLLQTIGGASVAVGRQLTFSAPAPATLLTGPVVLRGANGKAGATYRFLQVRN